MLIRFFNDWDLVGKERLLIGISFPTEDRGEAREAVRVATPDEVERYQGAYQAYRDALSENSPALMPHVGPGTAQTRFAERDPVTGRWMGHAHAGEQWAEHAGPSINAQEGTGHAGNQ